MKGGKRQAKPKSAVPKWQPPVPKVPANPTQWSEKSKRSYTFYAFPPHYEDIDFACTVCGHAAVFSAAEQKEAYEIKKHYIDERRHLCQRCYLELCRIQRKLRDCRTQWASAKGTLRNYAAFLRKWLELFHAHHRHGARRDTANIRRLEKLLAARAAPPR